MVGLLSLYSLLLTQPAHASEQAITLGIGPYQGGLGAAYTYSPVVGLGFQAGLGLGGAALGARWQPTWLSGGYAQAGLARVSSDGYHPNMVVGGKWNIGNSDLFLDANGGVAISLDGRWWPLWDIGLGRNF